MNQNFRDQFFLILAAIFISSLVACNLIFQKFFSWNPGDLYLFEISVGILPYPITFLATDLISELYGRKKANQVVLAGFIASIFVVAIVVIGQKVSATAWSPVNDETFGLVFGLSGPAVFASMSAYLLAQLIDVRLFHFWKKLTKGKHLWLRNNGSTVVSQLVDTMTVLLLLCATGVIPWDKFGALLENGFLFKVLVALIDTPIIYAILYLLKGKIKPISHEAESNSGLSASP